MELRELFDLHEKLESRINAYWNFWSVVVLAMAGWLLVKQPEWGMGRCIALALAAAAFFAANLGVIWHATRLASAVRDEMRLAAADTALRSPLLRTELADGGIRFRLASTLVLHGVVDLAVLAVIFFYAC
ncbi:hypothetical protein [Chitinolyticbacter albus]|uniref:hypothetical protein n=1 Tax=Chitinolyticbacter albus TaxID=2961951 RepID=UPI00210C3617|nr:hypothetical protein [Chitinolyticbacter albus]